MYTDIYKLEQASKNIFDLSIKVETYNVICSKDSNSSKMFIYQNQ